MSSLFGIAANGASEFYTTKINQSLRFNKPDTPYLERTFVTPSSTRKVIIATWIKPSELGSTTPIMYSAPTSATTSYFLMGFAQSAFIDSNDSFKIFTVEGNSAKIALRTNAKFRDTTNWLHVCVAIDSEQATSTDRVMIFFNGKRYTGGYDSYNTFPSQNHDFTVMNSAIKHRVGATSNGLHANYGNLQGYLSEFYFIDGQSMFSDTSGTINSTFLADANNLATFCEQKNGVAIPKTYSGTFGNNGCRLTFQATGTGTTSQGTTAQTNIGDDQSGQGHNFSVNALVSSDVVSDSPTNNFSTINSIRESLVYNGSVTFSEGNLQSVDAGTTYSLHWTGTFGMSTGKWYWEVLAHTMGGSHANIGICNAVHRVSTAGTGVFYGNDGKRNPVTYFSAQTNYGASYTSGDIIGVAFDADNETVTFYKNNSSQGAVGSVLVQSSGPYFAAAGDAQNATTYKYVVNFGQDSSFAGNKTAQGNKDGNGNGDFYYTPPSGHLALCSANLPDTDLSPNQLEQADDYFNTVLYSGDGNTTQNVTGVGFQPDWTWLKERSSTSGNVMADTNRGYDKFLVPNDSVVEGTGILNSVLSDGFQTTNSGASNQSGQTYVSWNWKVNGGTTSTDNNGSLTSTVQTDSKVGISIATFTVPTQANFSFGHGLGSVPEMFWWKSRTSTQNWIVYHFAKTPSVPNQNGLYLNSSLAGFTSGGNWITELSSTRIAITDGQVSSGSNRDDVVYSFKSVEGFSKIDSYVGNGSSNGTFVYTGFRPAWVIIKSTSGGRHWVIKDAVRNTYNVLNRTLLANSNTSEDTSSSYDIDFLSNGFKCRTSSAHTNTNGETHVYMAFAEQPFKFSNAR